MHLNLHLLMVGSAKVLLSLAVGMGLAFAAFLVVGRFLRWRDIREEVLRGNVAAGVLFAASLIALGLLIQHSLMASFAAFDALLLVNAFDWPLFVSASYYAVVHTALALGVGAVAITSAGILFDLATPNVDDFEEVHKGNVAIAIAIGSVILVLAIVLAPALSTLLDGILPSPSQSGS
jgi:uncharacterized membrane protein YjfL (UPF0719 family)